MLDADVVTEVDDRSDPDTTQSLDLIVPALDRLQVRLLRVTHERVRVYPARLVLADRRLSRDSFKCATQDEFINNLGKVLGSDEVRSVIESLIAQANEETLEAAPR